jgi:hypothetical protein
MLDGINQYRIVSLRYYKQEKTFYTVFFFEIRSIFTDEVEDKLMRI